MTRVVITVGRLTIGGAERRLLALAQELHARQAPVHLTFFVVTGQPGELDEAMRAAGARLVYGGVGLSGLAMLRRLCREVHADVLHINAETAAGFYGAAGAFAGVRRRIAHWRSMDPPRPALQRARYRCYELLTSAFCHQIIGVSDGARGSRVRLRPWRTIYNGITMPADETLAAMPAPPGYSRDAARMRLVVLGRVERTKRVDRAIRIAAAARREGLDVELHIVGPLVDVDAGSLERMSGECGIADVVHLHGAVADPLPFFAHASVALLTSEIEGLPGVLLESLSCGTPAVSTALPGALEIAARTAGVTCVALDAPDSIWVDAIRQARTDSRADIRSAFAASPFRVNRYVDDILSLWGVDA